MDYEKKYKEALKRAKILYNDKNEIGYANAESVLEEVFPLLKEPEDEKIRKALIEMVHDTTGDSLWVDYNVHKEDAIAWLEKQGERKPQRMVSAETKEAMYGKPAWSEKDEKILKAIHNSVDVECLSKNELDYVVMVDWFNALKDRVQPKQEWSEEDEKRIKDIISFLDTLEVKDANEALRTEYEKGRADVIADTLSWLENCWPKYCSNQTIIEGFKEAIKGE